MKQEKIEEELFRFINGKAIKSLPLARQGLLLLNENEEADISSFNEAEIIKLDRDNLELNEIYNLLSSRVKKTDSFGSDTVKPLIIIAPIDIQPKLYNENMLEHFDIIKVK